MKSPLSTGLKAESLRSGPSDLTTELFEAKLRSPLLGSTQVPRKLLLQRMNAGENAMVVNIVAAPGFGKTTFLTQWTSAEKRPVAWVSLDANDNDPRVLMTYLTVALAQAGPISRRIFNSLRASGSAIETRIVPRLIRAVEHMGTPLVLVLDDVHEIHEQESLDVLGTLIMRLPAHVQIVLSGRSEQGLPLPRLRSQGVVMDIGPRDLAFSHDEADALLRDAGLELSSEEVDDILNRTEGWPVGIYLSALAMGAGRKLSVVGPIGGDDPYVADYLRAEFLSHLPEETRTFLTRSSAVAEMSGPLCDAILERTGSAEELARLSRKNLLVIPQDRHDRWYRYHHLFRQLLVTDLQKNEPGVLQDLQSRAAHWYEKSGEPEVALRYAQEAEDTDYAAHLFTSVALNAYRTGHLSTVRRWLFWFIERNSHSEHPLLALSGAWILTMAGDAENAWKLSEFSEDDLSGMLLTDGVTPADAWAAQLETLWCRNGVAQMATDAQKALDLTPEGSSVSTFALLLSGIARLMAGERDEAEGCLSDAIDVGSRADVPLALLIALAEKAMLATQASDWETAEELVQRAEDIIDKRGLEEFPTNALVYAVSAHLLSRKEGVEAASDDLVRAQRLRPQLTYAIPWLSVQVRLELARSYLSLADPGGARTVLREAESIFRRRPDLGILRDQFDEMSMHVRDAPMAAPGMSTITSAELRLLPFLATHLSFPEIGERLYVSRHTVKSQAISIYRKLGVSSRSDAVKKAGELGLLEA